MPLHETLKATIFIHVLAFWQNFGILRMAIDFIHLKRTTMKILFGTVAMSIALLSFAGSHENKTTSDELATTTVYQDTLPKKDTSSKKDKKKKERRDSLYIR